MKYYVVERDFAPATAEFARDSLEFLTLARGEHTAPPQGQHVRTSALSITARQHLYMKADKSTWTYQLTRAPMGPQTRALSGSAVGRVGLWLIGARGSVAATAATGLAAISAGLAPATGCVTDQEAFASVPLPRFSDLLIGGHDISDVSIAQRVDYLVGAGMLPQHLVSSVRTELEAADERVCSGYHSGQAGVSQAEAARRLSRDIGEFRRFTSWTA